MRSDYIRWAFMMIAILMAPNAKGESASASSRSAQVQTTLIADVTAIVPGRPFHLGVRFQIEPGWHIYWSYPGDTGKPTEVWWRLPIGFKAGRLLYPTPVKIIDPGDLVSYGYNNQVLLASEITPPKELKPGETVDLAAQASWLACKTLCVLGSQTLTLRLPVAASPEQAEPANEDAFAAARRQTPVAPDEAQHVRIRTGLNVDRVRPGDPFEIGIELAIEHGWHLQSNKPLEEGFIATDLFLAPPEVISLDRPVFPPGVVKQFGEGLKLSLYEGRVPIRVPARATADLKPGQVAIDGVLVIQACSDEGTCLRPQYIAVKVLVEGAPTGAPVKPANADLFATPTAAAVRTSQAGPVQPPAGTAASKPSPSQTPASQMPPHARPSSLAYLLLAAFLAGLILNIMPCVLPVVSIKILSFVQQAGEEPRRVLILGLSFVLGMMIFFWGLGLLAVAVPVSPGAALRHPSGVIILTSVIFAFALSLFGVFEIRLPGRATAALSGAGAREGPLGALGKGFLATLLGTSCTAPVVSTVWVSALAASVPARLLIFTAMGLGMAAPYIILSANPGWLRFLPRPGPWMDTFKQFMGFVMAATGLWLLWVLAGQVGGDGLIWTLCFLTVLALGLWMIGRLGYDTTPHRWLLTYAGAIVIVVAGGWLTLGNLTTQPTGHGIAPPVSGSDLCRSHLDYSRSIPWQPYRPGLAEELAAAGRIVYLDYTARWCATCQSNKRLVLDTLDVRAAMQRLAVIPLEADFTNGSSDIERDLARFNRPSVPLNLVYGPGHVDNPIVLPELLTKDRVLEALEAAAAGKPGISSPGATHSSAAGSSQRT
jgi:thiol:disulfide interchange protein